MNKKCEPMPFYMPMPLNRFELARAYVVSQPYINRFPLDEALRKGNLFPNLYMPYKLYK